MFHDDMELFQCGNGEPKTPREFAEEGFTKGLQLYGQCIIIFNGYTVRKALTFRSVTKEHFLMTMQTIAEKLYDE
jgi:hypothetical protein